ncbi:MAG: polyprenol monophosphomannose synthase [Planctomycetota bacterium]
MTDSQPRLLVVIATYNEIDNLPRLMLRLQEAVPNAQLLIIDDGSPDGTGNWCESSRDKYPQMSVIHRDEKLGLGSAAMEGFRWALTRNFDLIATMDADLSHEPESLAQMVSLMQEPDQAEVGVCIGSRYVMGGGTEGWPWYRQWASRCVNGFARMMLRLPTYDCSGAFRVYRRTAIESIDLSQLKSNDYAYLEEILYRLHQNHVMMKEVPITFRNRDAGKSKTNAWMGLSVFWQILKMGIRG